MSGWWLSILSVVLPIGAYLLASGSQRERNAAIRRDATMTQLQRAIEREKSIHRLRPQRWYDSALAIALLATPVCQWLGYQYSGSNTAIILPLAVFLISYMGINGFDPGIIPRQPLNFRKQIAWIFATGAAFALLASAPSLPGIIATRVALLDLIGLLAALMMSSIIRSARLRPARS